MLNDRSPPDASGAAGRERLQHREETKMSTRIEALEARIAELEAKLVEPSPVTPPKPKAVIEEGARVFYVPTRNPSFVMPTAGELDQLRTIVVRAIPELAPQKNIYGTMPDDDALRREFADAIRAVSTLLRQEAVDHSRGVGFWVDHLNEQLRLTGRPSIDSPAFTLAALALHTRHCIGLASASFGLTLSVSDGKRASDEWRAVLSRGRIRPPDELPGEFHRWSMGGMVRSG